MAAATATMVLLTIAEVGRRMMVDVELHTDIENADAEETFADNPVHRVREIDLRMIHVPQRPKALYW